MRYSYWTSTLGLIMITNIDFLNESKTIEFKFDEMLHIHSCSVRQQQQQQRRRQQQQQQRRRRQQQQQQQQLEPCRRERASENIRPYVFTLS
jgi:transcription initiation factor TFIID subunit TAF12